MLIKLLLTYLLTYNNPILEMGFGETGFGETGFGETGFGETGGHHRGGFHSLRCIFIFIIMENILTLLVYYIILLFLLPTVHLRIT